MIKKNYWTDIIFSGSDEFVLRDVADHSNEIVNILMKNMVELKFTNNLILYELGNL